VLVRLIVKKTPGVYAYASVRNQRTDFPVLACAAANVSGTYRISVGARPGRAICITDEEGFLTDGITEERAKQFAKWVETKIPTAGNHRGSAAYRTRLTGALCYRLTKKIGEEQA
jgi:putative selenate reductase FAD-binding subunit